MANELLNVAVFGSSGAIGKEFVNSFLNTECIGNIFSFSRSKTHFNNDKIKERYINYDDENTLIEAADFVGKNSTLGMGLDMVIVASGILYEKNIMPEKSLRDLSLESFQRLFLVNAIFPSLIAKHFITLMNKEKKSVFALLSAKVGSISDNSLGGWYAYRASKAALNMIIKNISLEVQRKNNNMIVVGLHPGTVDSKLSKPFQNNLDQSKIFTPEYSVQKMLEVMKDLDSSHSGKYWSWDGSEIKP
jgi:NAD(P)-dependent dehydrogenase (short-subunit alcohol dehydrogenase family)